jgi:hypothetical protein
MFAFKDRAYKVVAISQNENGEIKIIYWSCPFYSGKRQIPLDVATLQGRSLTLTANITLGWKGIPRTNPLPYLAHSYVTKKK